MSVMYYLLMIRKLICPPLTAQRFDSVLSSFTGVDPEARLLAEQADVDCGFIVSFTQQTLKPAPETEALQLLQLLLTFHSLQLEHTRTPHFDLLDICSYNKPQGNRHG